MGKSDIPEIMLSCGAVQFSANDTIPVVVSFSAEMPLMKKTGPKPTIRMIIRSK